MINLVIKGRYPDMNKIINADRTHWAIGAKLKKDSTESIAWQLPNIKLKTPIYIYYTFKVPKQCRLDPDNMFSGFQKAFLDALQKKGLLDNDSRKEIKGFSVNFSEDEDYTTLIDIEENL